MSLKTATTRIGAFPSTSTKTTCLILVVSIAASGVTRARAEEPEEAATLAVVSLVVGVVGTGVTLYSYFAGDESDAYAYGYATAGGTWNPWCGAVTGSDEAETNFPVISATADSGTQSTCGASARGTVTSFWTMDTDSRKMTWNSNPTGTMASAGQSYAYAQYIADGQQVARVKRSLTESTGGSPEGGSGELFEVTVDVVLNEFSLSALSGGPTFESGRQALQYHNAYTDSSYEFTVDHDGFDYSIVGADDAVFTFDDSTGMLTAPSDYVLFSESFMVPEETDIDLSALFGGHLQSLNPSAAPVVGDFNLDEQFNCDDIDQLVFAIANGLNDPEFDLTFDGRVDQQDLQTWLAVAGAHHSQGLFPFLPGDANLDGVVDGVDFVVWNNHKFSSTAAWCAGDFNADGHVDGQDFVIWNDHKFQQSTPANPVPEPIGLASLVWAAMGSLALRRRV